MMKNLVFGKETTAQVLQSWRGALVEVRQQDSISGENIIMLDKETILKLAEMLKGEEN
jgi:chemotaxis protein CheY-P-specific phosphatase CheC